MPIARGLGVSVLLAAACAGEAEPPAGGGGGVAAPFECAAGELQLEGDRCLPAGVQPNGCAAGELSVEGNGCQAAGIPPELCAQGFEPDGDGGCVAVLPARPCPMGHMAVPGETSCRLVAPCGAAAWGAIPVEPDTQYVDASFAGSASDGSANNPWTTIADAIANAAPGAIVALAAGDYAEAVLVEDKPVRLWGRCPEMVTIVGNDADIAAVSIWQGAAGSELHDLAVRGGSVGVMLSGSRGVVFERVWIHDTASRSLNVQSDFGATQARLSRSLVELGTDIGVFAAGSELTIAETVVRDTQPTSQRVEGKGIYVEDGFVDTAIATIDRSLIERNRMYGVTLEGAQGTLSGTVVRDTLPSANDQSFGRGVGVLPGVRGAAQATIVGSVVERNRDIGIHISGSSASIEATVVADTIVQASDDGAGRGINIQAAPMGERSNVTVRSCLLDQNHDVGVFASASDAVIEGAIVRATQPQVFDQSSGRGFNIQQSSAGDPADVTIRGSMVAGNHDLGVYVQASSATIEGTVVRETQARGYDGLTGNGISVQDTPDTGQRATAFVRWSLVEQNRSTGMTLLGSDATIEGTILRDTQPTQATSSMGRGLEVGDDPDTGQRASVALRGSILERNRDCGIFIHGADANIHKSIVRDSLPRLLDNIHGRGIQIQDGVVTLARSNVVLQASTVERSSEFGIIVYASDATLDGVVVEDTAPNPADGSFGDGVTVVSVSAPTAAVIRNSRIARSSRAGLSVFGALVQLGASRLDCNTIHLDGANTATPYVLEDLGANVCGCGSEPVSCKVTSANLAPPAPLDETAPD